MIKTKNLEGAKIVSANRLRDGAVVFLGESGEWSLAVDDSAVARDDTRAAELLAIGAKAAAAQIVVAPYLVEVTLDDSRVVPLTYRERIRAFGPSIPFVQGLPQAAALPKAS
jgi:sulfite reductase (NADPH) hemoprotein beta-component